MRVSREVSEQNTLNILHKIWQCKKISRIQIAESLRIDKSTVTKTATALVQKNIVLETELGSAKPQGGRKPVFLEINGDYACTAGIQIEKQTRVCLVNLRGEILFEQILPCTENAISVLQKAAARLRIKIAAIGVAASSDTSLPDAASSDVASAKNTAPNNTPLFQESPVVCCCYAECFNIENSDSKNILYVLLQDDLKKASLGFSLEGKIYRGAEAGVTKAGFVIEEKNALKDAGKKIAFLADAFLPDYVFIGGSEKSSAQKIAEYARSVSVNATSAIATATIFERAVPYGAAIMAQDRLFSTPRLAPQI